MDTSISYSASVFIVGLGLIKTSIHCCGLNFFHQLISRLVEIDNRLAYYVINFHSTCTIHKEARVTAL